MMDEQYAAMNLGEDDDGYLMYDNDTGENVDLDDRWCLVGRFLMERTIDFDAMQHKMTSLWRPVRGLFAKELEPNLFLFQFYHDMDIDRVMEGSPWTFDRIPLIFDRLKPGENPRCVTPITLEFWVQVHGAKIRGGNHAGIDGGGGGTRIWDLKEQLMEKDLREIKMESQQ
ncbi:hypothetical protein F8388_017490 [Cannabis sativa]|uniref:DUF4283 domain-containing protein n=1 Tax=Cannabis sativa TaxID=3483 RepID=A0A7J6I7Q8_CANSA|nr:hypothetical protein F8388_017490 [Cannabis sativa]KAF4403652.1 hypothetical protein G4B88_002505 [Cannabis sativa]